MTELEVGSQLTIDHFQPKTAGGSDEIDNLVYACHACNLYKSQAWDSLDPPILHPLKADMNKLIAAESDGTLTGMTPEAIRHIDALHLNRGPLVAHRKTRLLIESLTRRDAEVEERQKQLDRAIPEEMRKIPDLGFE